MVQVIIDRRVLLLRDPETDKEFTKPISQCKFFRDDTMGISNEQYLKQQEEKKKKKKTTTPLSRPSRTRKRTQQPTKPKKKRKKKQSSTPDIVEEVDETYERQEVSRGEGKRKVTRFMVG